MNVSSVQIFRRIHAFAVGEEHPRGSSPSRKASALGKRLRGRRPQP
ncbi:hypothetical protein HMPREF9440_01177 [Sutterella parvirubra YIT 11816]|uniref:Uncharacterized protein n=1 Tax=Sutterella parvirubra YIT 11816 TaxID=762967 RepID=H3KEL3_9BURK|nr:hypothetical protein HMPREF9440_01177 [Sutterella parvirubra YIT 11816]